LLTNVIDLNLGHTKVTDLTPLRELKSLSRLGVAENTITDLTPLRELKSLSELDLRKDPSHRPHPTA
jgi:internalin A